MLAAHTDWLGGGETSTKAGRITYPGAVNARFRPDRRHLILTSLAAGAAATLAACDRARSDRITAAKATRFNLGRLDEGFAIIDRRAQPAMLGVGVASLDSPDMWISDPKARFPMQSVFKAPLAATALAQVDAGRWRLNDIVRLTPEDLSVGRSLINPAFRPPYLDLPIADLVALAVQQSDNTAADTLVRRLGGPAAVSNWLAANGVADMRVDRYERDLQPEMIGLGAFRPEWVDPARLAAATNALAPMDKEAAVAAYLDDPRDTTTVAAAMAFLRRLAGGKLLSPSSTALLLRLMTDTNTGPQRLLAGLPPGAALAHKTGTSVTAVGLTAAVNDIGIVTLDDGRRFAIASFLARSTASEAERDRLLADTARLAVSSLI